MTEAEFITFVYVGLTLVGAVIGIILATKDILKS